MITDSDERSITRIPMLFSLRDVVIITGAVVSIAFTWGIMSSRLSTLEVDKDQKDKIVETLQQQIHAMDVREAEMRTQIAVLLDQSRSQPNKTKEN